MGYVHPTCLSWGGAKFPSTAYLDPPLVDDIGVDIIEGVDLLCCMAGLRMQRHQHELLHLWWTAEHQPLAWVQPLSREQESQETTPGQAPAAGQEKQLERKGVLSLVLCLFLRLEIPVGSCMPLYIVWGLLLFSH